MADKDIHLAAASISDETRVFFEQIGFVEDVFRESENCSPTVFHATFRGSLGKINTSGWNELIRELRSDPAFNGLLEQEELVAVSYGIEDLYFAILSVNALETQPCPPNVHKACDIHISIKLDDDGEETRKWMSFLRIASFTKARNNGIHRIFSATFDSLEAGERFYDFIRRTAPRSAHATFKVKLERVVHALRVPPNAVTLPLTYAHQLDSWIRSAPKWHSEKFSSAHQMKHDDK